MVQPGQPPDRRFEQRVNRVSNHRAEFKFTGVPVYQLKVRDLTSKGAGIIAKTDSNFLRLIQVGQEMEVKLIGFAGAEGPCGRYRSKIEHISELKDGRFRGHMVVGLSILNKIS